MSQVSELSVRIGADTTDLTKGIDQAKTGLTGLEKKTNDTAVSLKELAAVGLAVGAATAIMVRNAINLADGFDDLSKKVGVSTQELSKLRYLFEMEGIAVEALEGSLSRLTKGMSDASQGTGDALKAFQALGISVVNSDGSLRSSVDVMGDVADRFSEMQDGANKTAIAISIFGRAGAQLIPTLNGGRQAIKDAGDELERFGGVVTPEAAAQAGIFNDNIYRLGEAAKGAAHQLATALLPSLIEVTQALLAANEVRIKEGFWATLLGMTELGQLLTGDDIEKQVLERFRGINKAQQQAIAESQAGNNKMPPPAMGGSLEEQKKQVQDRLKVVQEALMSESQLLDKKYQDDQKTLQEALKAQAITQDEYNQAIQELRIKHQEKLWEIEANSPDALRAQQLAQNVLALEQSLLTEEELLIADYEKKHEMLRDFYTVQGEITAEGKAVLEKLEEDHVKKLNNVRLKGLTDIAKFSEQIRQKDLKGAMGTLQSMTSATAGANKDMFNINKAATLANATMDAYAAITGAYKVGARIGGPPVGAAFAAAAGAFQFAQLKNIAGQQFNGGSRGGGTVAPSVAASTPAGATPVSDAGGGGGGTNQVVTINLTGEIFGREQVRGLISQINEAISDGATLRLT